jgi:hypothetical protein
MRRTRSAGVRRSCPIQQHQVDAGVAQAYFGAGKLGGRQKVYCRIIPC